jgi:hypothetical protein
MLFRSRAKQTIITEGKNAKFLAINHEPISRDLGGKKILTHKFTILKPTSAGFASAPYKLKTPKRDPDSKPLSEMKYTAEGLPVMTMWSFKKQGAPGNKGPRSELSWTLQAGNTIKLWLDEERVKDAELLTGDVAAFTVCEISVASKNEESVRGGWCIKVTAIRPANLSLHSMTTDLSFLCSNLGEAKMREMLAKSNQPLLEKELESQYVALWSPVHSEAVLEETGGTVRLLNWGADNFPVEMPHEALMQATNCKRTDWACALLEVAIAAGALSILVVVNDFWKGGPRAIPVISAERLLDGIKHPGTHVTPYSTTVNDEVGVIEIEIGKEAMPIPGSKPPPCEDFELTGLDTELALARSIQFNIKCKETTIPAVWKGYYNAGPTHAAPVLAKRKRMQTMDE